MFCNLAAILDDLVVESLVAEGSSAIKESFVVVEANLTVKLESTSELKLFIDLVVFVSDGCA